MGKGIARIKGAFVLAVASTYDFAVGASVSVLEFANFEGAFDKIFFVKMRSRSSRALLQNSGAANANVACSGTSCQATGASTGGVPSFGKKKTDAPAATAYGAPEGDNFSLSTESSSSTYEFDY